MSIDTEEMQGLEEEETGSAYAEAEEAAFQNEIMSRYNEADNDDDQIEEPDAPTADEIAQQQPRSLIAGLTDDQVKELLLKAQSVDQIKAEVHRLGSMAQQRSGAGLNISPDDFEEITKEYSPEMAKMIAAGLKRSLEKATLQVSGGGVDPEAINQAISERMDLQSRQYEAKLLSAQHPDWQDIAKSQDFRLWVGGLVQEKQQLLANTWDSAVISSAIKAFKKTQAQDTNKAKRLQSAITPTRGAQTSGRKAMTEDEAFNQEFKRLRRR